MKVIYSCCCIVALSTSPTALAEGADVILGELIGPRVYASHQGVVAITVGTTSCNAGSKILDWKALPDNRHPVITMNLYRLLNGRMTQIGQSWVKHGFVALQQNVCGFGCQPSPSGDGLGVGCSDPYGAITNQGPHLGSRRLINPTTGHYDGTLAKNELDAFQPTTPIDHGLQVREEDLAVPGARYFIEGHYIASDDAAAGKGNNNVSHTEVHVSRDGAGNFLIENAQPGPRATVREMPAIRAWPYAEFAHFNGSPNDGSIIVAHTVTRISRTTFRYEYAVYNMNSERAINSFSVPTGAASVSNVGSSAVRSHGETWTNDPWQSAVSNGHVTWSTQSFEVDQNANAIRWGTTHNFWFESEAPPVTGNANLGRFKAGDGPSSFSVVVRTPSS